MLRGRLYAQPERVLWVDSDLIYKQNPVPFYKFWDPLSAKGPWLLDEDRRGWLWRTASLISMELVTVGHSRPIHDSISQYFRDSTYFPDADALMYAIHRRPDVLEVVTEDMQLSFCSKAHIFDGSSSRYARKYEEIKSRN